MAFDDFEQSRWGGKPIHLFIFTRPPLVWRYSSSDRDIIIDGNTYLAAQISRSEIKQTVEREKDKLTIKVAYLRDQAADEFPVTQPLGDNWFPYIPSGTVFVTCLATHFGDTGAPVVEWSGQVTQPKFNDVELDLVCEPTSDVGRARNQGPKWQRSCWKTVYSTGPRGCNLDPATFQVVAELTAADGLTVTADEFGESELSLAGGTATWTRGDGLVERRSIMRQTGDDIVLLYGAADLDPGVSVTALPGCPRTWAACDERGNTLNYGGAIYKPVKNPMDGVSMSWG